MNKCPKCNALLKKVKVNVQDADKPVLSYQCAKCGFFDFEKKSISKAINDIKAKEDALTIKQKVIKLSKGRLGMYFNRDVARSLDLKAGCDVYVSVPDKQHVILRIEG